MDIKHSIVGIIAGNESSYRFLGTGFFVAGQLVLTCAHVVGENKSKGDLVFFQFEEHDQICTGQIDFYSPESDLESV